MSGASQTFWCFSVRVGVGADVRYELDKLAENTILRGKCGPLADVSCDRVSIPTNSSPFGTIFAGGLLG